jgi:hypothetical protein
MWSLGRRSKHPRLATHLLCALTPSSSPGRRARRSWQGDEGARAEPTDSAPCRIAAPISAPSPSFLLAESRHGRPTPPQLLGPAGRARGRSLRRSRRALRRGRGCCSPCRPASSSSTPSSAASTPGGGVAGAAQAGSRRWVTKRSATALALVLALLLRPAAPSAVAVELRSPLTQGGNLLPSVGGSSSPGGAPGAFARKDALSSSSVAARNRTPPPRRG